MGTGNAEDYVEVDVAHSRAAARECGKGGVEMIIDELKKWLYEEGMKFEKICDSAENYTDAASACARRAQCYYTIEKIEKLKGEIPQRTTSLSNITFENEEELKKHDQRVREKIYDDLGVLYGESAKKFQEYMDAPPTEKDREISKRVYAIIERDRIEAEKPIRKDERGKVFDELEQKIQSITWGGGIHTGWILLQDVGDAIKELRGE